MQRARLEKLLDGLKHKVPLRAEDAYDNYKQSKKKLDHCLNDLDKMVRKLNNEQLQIFNLKRNK